MYSTFHTSSQKPRRETGSRSGIAKCYAPSGKAAISPWCVGLLAEERVGINQHLEDTEDILVLRTCYQLRSSGLLASTIPSELCISWTVFAGDAVVDRTLQTSNSIQMDSNARYSHLSVYI